MSKQKTKQNGVTLIALVITIIVLLILAGISISMLVGDNGVLNKAKNARQNTQRAELVEQARLDISDKQTNNLDSKLKKSELVEVLNRYFENVPENSDDLLSETVTSKPEYGNYSVVVSEIYNNGFLDEENVDPTLPNQVIIKIPKNYKIIKKDGITGDILEESDEIQGIPRSNY